ncbi:MAG TPA: hypothetical protein VMT57_08785 [Candidatus Thermoplasmatota archaeon]|nr:hypothetical protein [Candidatus Thermoplasmatota archaeon]
MKSNIIEIHPKKIGFHGKSQDLGKILGHKGVTDILYLLNESPRQYKHLVKELNLANATLEVALNQLESIQIIKTMPITSKNRETHQYHLTLIGVELLRFLSSYEKMISLPLSQQKIIEIEKTK